MRSSENQFPNASDLLVEAFTDEYLFNLIKSSLDVEYMTTQIKDSVNLSLKIALESTLNDLTLFVRDRLDALENSRRELIWQLGKSGLQFFESGLQDNDAAFQFEESKQDCCNRIAAQRAIIADMLKNLGTDEARVLEFLGKLDAIKRRDRETIGNVHESSPVVGCGDTSTLGDTPGVEASSGMPSASGALEDSSFASFNPNIHMYAYAHHGEPRIAIRWHWDQPVNALDYSAEESEELAAVLLNLAQVARQIASNLSGDSSDFGSEAS